MTKFNLKDNLTSRLTVVFICILVIAFREIDLLLYPRFWAEEALIFYNYSLHHGWYDIFTTPQVGYLTLFNSFTSGIQAKFISYESAPVFTTYAGFLVQMIPVFLIVFSSHIFWNSIFKKFICSVMVLVVTAPELMLNTTNSHFIFGLITFLILVIPVTDLSKLKKYSYRCLLFIGALTGPASMFLTPLFLYKAYREKNREKYIQASIMFVCSLVNAVALTYAILYDNTYKRLEQHDFDLTINAFFADNFSLNVNRPWFGMIMAGVYILLFIKHRKSNEHLVFLVSFLIIAVFSTIGSLQMQGSLRYAYVPTCIFMLLLASETFEIKLSKPNFTNIFSGLIFAGCLFLSIIFYHHRMATTYQKTLPKWKDEVAKYRKDNKYNPLVHPDYMYVQFYDPNH